MIQETKPEDGYYDDILGFHMVPILAGQCSWTRSKNIAYSTTLGSCLSVCIFDHHAGVGGMNHFLLPQAGAQEEKLFSQSFRYGSAAIESLINALLANGAAKNDITIKIFGGANVLKNASLDIGAQNLKFTRCFFTRENLRIETEDVGGVLGRRLIFHPRSGKVYLKHLQDKRELIKISQKEASMLNKVSQLKKGNDVELF